LFDTLDRHSSASDDAMPSSTHKTFDESPFLQVDRSAGFRHVVGTNFVLSDAEPPALRVDRMAPPVIACATARFIREKEAQ
jgi:hypothetical protein